MSPGLVHQGGSKNTNPSTRQILPKSREVFSFAVLSILVTDREPKIANGAKRIKMDQKVSHIAKNNICSSQ